MGIGIGESGTGSSGGSNRCHGRVLGFLLDGRESFMREKIPPIWLGSQVAD